MHVKLYMYMFLAKCAHAHAQNPSPKVCHHQPGGGGRGGIGGVRPRGLQLAACHGHAYGHGQKKKKLIIKKKIKKAGRKCLKEEEA